MFKVVYILVYTTSFLNLFGTQGCVLRIVLRLVSRLFTEGNLKMVKVVN